LTVPRQTEETRRLAVACYQAVECEGMARVDFLLEAASGRIYIKETGYALHSASLYGLWSSSRGCSLAQQDLVVR